jgi:hypothetical protein
MPTLGTEVCNGNDSSGHLQPVLATGMETRIFKVKTKKTSLNKNNNYVSSKT